MIVNTAAMCKRQEAIHRETAAATTLTNVRRIALRAAAAWEKQAQEMTQKEAGEKGGLSPEDAAIALEFLLEEENDRPDAIEDLAKGFDLGRDPANRLSHDIA
jgi:hypothetical protein